jgi:hypothetical protein
MAVSARDSPTLDVNEESVPATSDVPAPSTNGVISSTYPISPATDETLANHTPASPMQQPALQLVTQFISSFPLLMSFVANYPDAFTSLLEKLGPSVVDDWQKISTALRQTPPPASNTRGQSRQGLGKLCNGKWIEGFKFYTAQKGNFGDKESAYAYIMCRLLAPLGNCPEAILKEIQNVGEEESSASSPTPNSALRFIALACAYNRCKSKAFDCSNQLQAAAYALSFLASPRHWREHLGGMLETMAEQILQEHSGELAPLFGVVCYLREDGEEK